MWERTLKWIKCALLWYSLESILVFHFDELLNGIKFEKSEWKKEKNQSVYHVRENSEVDKMCPPTPPPSKVL